MNSGPIEGTAIYFETIEKIATSREKLLAESLSENARLREEVEMWKERYKAAEQALDATVKDFNRYVSDGP